MRELVELELENNRLVGCLHRPGAAPPEERGFLLLSFGHVARSGVGDLSAHLGDALAAVGFPAFRFDFPGLGDSPGPLPREEDRYFNAVQRGDHAELALALAAEVRRRFQLRSLVLGGLCGGAITSVFAADRAPKGIAGLVLLEPDFSLVPVVGEAKGSAANHEGLAGLARRLVSPRSWMRLVTGESRFSRSSRLLRPILRPLLLRGLAGRLPSDTNRELVLACRRVVRRGLPILLLTAEGKVRELYTRRVAPFILDRSLKKDLAWVTVPGTNHVFSAGGGREVVARSICEWMGTLEAPGAAPRPPRGSAGPIDGPGPLDGVALEHPPGKKA